MVLIGPINLMRRRDRIISHAIRVVWENTRRNRTIFISMSYAQLIYISKAVDMVSQQQLDQLASDAHLNNGMCDLSGVLLYGQGHFLQVLEGPLHAVNSLFARIQQDSRHCEINLLSFVPIRKRHFVDWEMEVLSLEKMRDLDPRPLKRVMQVFESRSITQMGDFGKIALALVEEFDFQMNPTSVARSKRRH